MLSVARLVSFWRCIPMQYNCQKSSNFQGLSHFPGYLAKMTKFQDFSMLEKLSPFFQVFQELWEPCNNVCSDNPNTCPLFRLHVHIIGKLIAGNFAAACSDGQVKNMWLEPYITKTRQDGFSFTGPDGQVKFHS